MPWPDEEIQWTADDIKVLKEAILKKANGTRLTAEDLGGKMQQWADAPLDQLRALLEEMKTNVTSAGAVDAMTRRPMIFRSRYSKGL